MYPPNAFLPVVYSSFPHYVQQAVEIEASWILMVLLLILNSFLNEFVFPLEKRPIWEPVQGTEDGYFVWNYIILEHIFLSLRLAKMLEPQPLLLIRCSLPGMSIHCTFWNRTSKPFSWFRKTSLDTSAQNNLRPRVGSLGPYPLIFCLVAGVSNLTSQQAFRGGRRGVQKVTSDLFPWSPLKQF